MYKLDANMVRGLHKRLLEALHMQGGALIQLYVSESMLRISVYTGTYIKSFETLHCQKVVAMTENEVSHLLGFLK